MTLWQCIIDKLGKCSVSDQDVECPHDDCSARVHHPKAVADECQMELDLLYPPIHSSLDIKQQLQHSPSDADKVVNVVMLTGDSARIPFSPQMTIEQLKTEIEKKLKVQPDKQQLTYNDKVLEVTLLSYGLLLIDSFSIWFHILQHAVNSSVSSYLGFLRERFDIESTLNF